ncbi:MAG: Jag N-terminal domain-containing protein [Acidimicrobiia bacterium]|nr:Jag N-terminal domain-containing protein [Acidimicrobiia bacterium]
MEWVEITGRTVEEAKDAALDQLGVDTVDAEFEILEEPSRGLFGKTKGQARVRARIAPTQPRPKVERRDRRKKSSGTGGSRNKAQRPDEPATDAAPAAPASNGKRPNRRSSGPKAEPTEKENTTVTETVDVDLAEHSRIVTEFLDGLVDSFDLEGRVEAVSIDEETTEVRVEGRDLGILVGPKGNTLAAIQELSRTVIHRKVSGTAAGRVRLDVAGYRQRRREALEQFTREVAEEVRSSGVQKALEPMGSADRKVVHDAVNEIEGVSTISEGDEPRRRVVLIPS